MDKQTLKQKLFEIRKAIKPVKKTEENPYFKSKYFDINILVAGVMPMLQEKNILLNQPLIVVDGKSALKTSFWDIDSDDCIESVVLLPDGLDAQKMGSAITYLRRYSIQSLLCLEAEDDDGNVASNAEPKYQPVGTTTTMEKRKVIPTPQVNSSDLPF